MVGIHPLRTYRKSQTPNLSQAGLAAQLGVSRLTVVRWENDQHKIDPDLVPMVAEKTGIPAKDLRPDIVENHIKVYGTDVSEAAE